MGNKQQKDGRAPARQPRIVVCDAPPPFSPRPPGAWDRLTVCEICPYITDQSVSNDVEGPMNVRLILSLAAAAAVLGCSKPEPPPEPVRAVRTLVVGSEDAQGVQEYAAEVRARTESRLGFRVGGKLLSRPADLGDAVRAGQLLAQLDPQDLRLGQEAARAAVQAAVVNAEQAAADFKRFKELRDQGFISSAELERRETALKAAQAQVQQATAQASVQGNQAAYSSLVATASGVITAVEAEVGAVVAAGTPVVRLAHDGPRDVVFSVPEDRAAFVRSLLDKPAAVKVRLWGNGAAAVPATVREVAASTDPVTRTFLVKADVGRADMKLGQTASVQIETPKVAGAIKLPLAAVIERQGQTAVWLLDPATMTVKPQPVQVAGAEGNRVVLASGLAPGQTVVTAGVHVLTPGQKVKRYVEPSTTASSR
jgi:membrane fusion protein, multidrug efflux system